jgi:hypothetical protein
VIAFSFCCRSLPSHIHILAMAFNHETFRFHLLPFVSGHILTKC